MWAKVIKLKIMSKNKRHNDLEMKYNNTRTVHSQVHCRAFEDRKTKT